MIIVSDGETYMRKVQAVDNIYGPIYHTIELDGTREGVHEDHIMRISKQQANRLAKKIYTGVLST